MVGYWPSAFPSQYPAILTKQTWSIKDLLYGFRENVSCGLQRVVPSGQDSAILSAWVANHNVGFGSSCPLMELAIKIMDCIAVKCFGQLCVRATPKRIYLMTCQKATLGQPDRDKHLTNVEFLSTGTNDTFVADKCFFRQSYFRK